jgi:hypothetical protein
LVGHEDVVADESSVQPRNANFFWQLVGEFQNRRHARRAGCESAGRVIITMEVHLRIHRVDSFQRLKKERWSPEAPGVVLRFVWYVDTRAGVDYSPPASG